MGAWSLENALTLLQDTKLGLRGRAPASGGGNVMGRKIGIRSEADRQSSDTLSWLSWLSVASRPIITARTGRDGSLPIFGNACTGYRNHTYSTITYNRDHQEKGKPCHYTLYYCRDNMGNKSCNTFSACRRWVGYPNRHAQRFSPGPSVPACAHPGRSRRK